VLALLCNYELLYSDLSVKYNYNNLKVPINDGDTESEL
jgi:hypothetical protein